jgi:hypothetical protein
VQDYQLFSIGIEESILTMVHKLRNTVEKLIFFQVLDESLLLFSEDNLKLLAHYAKEENKTLVLLTENRELRQKAAGILPAAESIEDYLSEPAAEKDEQRSRAGLPKWAKVVLVAAVCVFVLLASLKVGLEYWMAPKVVVTVYPKILTTETDLRIALGELNVIPETLEIKKVATTAATGKTVVGTQRATGEVVFFNQNPKEVKLYKGTQLKARNGNIYQLTEDVLIPGAEVVYVLDVKSSQTAGQALGFIEAIELGDQYNVKAGEITELVESYPDITVRNLNDITGGKSETRPTVVQDDLTKARQQVVELLNKETVKVGSGEYLLPGSTERAEPVVVYDQKVGDFAPTVTASGTQKVSYRKITGADVQQKIENILPNLLPTAYNLVSGSPRVKNVEFEKDAVKVSASFELYPTLDAEEIASVILGKDPEEAEILLGEIGRLTFDGLKDEESLLPTRKQWLKVVLSDEYDADKTFVNISLNQSI